jgi:hypothetical protein
MASLNLPKALDNDIERTERQKRTEHGKKPDVLVITNLSTFSFEGTKIFDVKRVVNRHRQGMGKS